ncbi:unnamed protein product [Hydatigera taeniaeformis]|uniref:ABC transporter permease n=1 Tax=Hydatigena taeniaeformis TaxID=6205 RepID=A0A0R3X704_HYDTA|nr:unnamed protein product [Hydatigera taeniaeformis]
MSQISHRTRGVSRLLPFYPFLLTLVILLISFPQGKLIPPTIGFS